MTFSKNIIVLSDLLEQTKEDLQQSYTFAKLSKSKINLLFMNGGNVKDLKDKLTKITNEESLASGIAISFKIIEGNKNKDIIKFAEDEESQLVVVRSKIFYTIDKGHRLARRAPCPVLILKEPAHTEYKTIILPLDLTKESREKVNNVIEFATYFGATVKVLAVRTNDEIASENKLISYSHQVKNYIKGKGIDSTIRTLAGEDIAKLVVDYCTIKEGDMVMIVNPPELGLIEMFKGTTAQQVIDRSEIPVLSVPPLKRKDTSVSTTPY